VSVRIVDARPFADDLARVLAAEPVGSSCAALAGRVGRRWTTVQAALRGDARFAHEGRTRGSRWRLAETDSREEMGRVREGISGPPLPWVGLDPSGVPLVGRRAESTS
jgi:hypothetical protein